jgi:hypothetical protein
MPQVQFASNIGRWQDNDKRLLSVVYFRGEVALLEPEIIPFLLYLAWLICTRYFGHF